MKPVTLTLLATLLTAAPAIAEAPSGDADRAALQIEAGRLGVMMSQSRELLPTLPGKEAPPAVGVQSDRAAIYDALVSAVLSYNILSWRACHAGVVGGDLCRGPYLPPWLGKPGGYSDAQLRAMTDDASGRLMPFWNAICAKAAKPPGETTVCPME